MCSFIIEYLNGWFILVKKFRNIPVKYLFIFVTAMDALRGKSYYFPIGFLPDKLISKLYWSNKFYYTRLYQMQLSMVSRPVARIFQR